MPMQVAHIADVSLKSHFFGENAGPAGFDFIHV